MVKTMTRTELPAKINREMDRWRCDLGGLPESYITFHEGLARESLKTLAVTVHRVYMAHDGWMDGMRFIHAIVERKNGELTKIKWCDSQCWMEQIADHCGWKGFKF